MYRMKYFKVGFEALLYNASISLWGYLESIRASAGDSGAADGQGISSIGFNGNGFRVAALQAGVKKFLAVFIGQAPVHIPAGGGRLRNGKRQRLPCGGGEVINILLAGH